MSLEQFYQLHKCTPEERRLLLFYLVAKRLMRVVEEALAQ